eukprot:5674194-Prymnesium_polylepis.1
MDIELDDDGEKNEYADLGNEDVSRARHASACRARGASRHAARHHGCPQLASSHARARTRAAAGRAGDFAKGLLPLHHRRAPAHDRALRRWPEPVHSGAARRQEDHGGPDPRGRPGPDRRAAVRHRRDQ